MEDTNEKLFQNIYVMQKNQVRNIKGLKKKTKNGERNFKLAHN